MGKCNYCKGFILFGGVKDEEKTFCNKKCNEQGRFIMLADTIPLHLIDQLAEDIYNSKCPKCKKRSELGIFKSHYIYSFILFTSYGTTPELSCKTCAVKKQFSSMLTAFIVGWWAIPWGIMMTPVMIIKNIYAMIFERVDGMPSEALKDHAKILLAHDLIERESVNN